MALQVNSVSWLLTIMPGLPRRPINSVRTRATFRPETEVSGIAARHSRVTSSPTLRIRNRRPQASSAYRLDAATDRAAAHQQVGQWRRGRSAGGLKAPASRSRASARIVRVSSGWMISSMPIERAIA